LRTGGFVTSDGDEDLTDIMGEMSSYAEGLSVPDLGRLHSQNASSDNDEPEQEVEMADIMAEMSAYAEGVPLPSDAPTGEDLTDEADRVLRDMKSFTLSLTQSALMRDEQARKMLDELRKVGEEQEYNRMMQDGNQVMREVDDLLNDSSFMLQQNDKHISVRIDSGLYEEMAKYAASQWNERESWQVDMSKK